MNDYVPTEDVEAPYSVTLRTGAGYDAALLTIRGNDAVQLISRLGELEVNDGLARVVEFNSSLQAKAGAATPAGDRSTGTPSRSGSSTQNQQAAGSRAAASSDLQFHPEGLKCQKANCGAPVIYKQITQKKPPYKDFKMWVCENQRERGDQHHSEFIN